MAQENLNPDELAAMTRALRNTIAADRFPLSPRIRTLKSALAKLDPEPQPMVEPYPPSMAWVNSGIGKRKSRR
jgi:hypothetical protein